MVERRRDAESSNPIASPQGTKLMLEALAIAGPGEPDIDQPNRFAGRAAIWSCNARNAESPGCTESRSHADGHLLGDGMADGTVFLQILYLHIQQLCLDGVVVGNHPAPEIARAAWNSRDRLTQSAARAGLGYCQRGLTGVE